MKTTSTPLHELMVQYPIFRAKEISGRYITPSHIEPLIKKTAVTFLVKEIGRSTKGNPIHTIVLGKGPVKIFAWSQMHGNETTSTKAIFDLLQAVQLYPDNTLIRLIIEKITLVIIPMLNPDGAIQYTRENANGTDLNRDALRLKETESKLLHNIFKDLDPDFCFNLHDQRTIFSAGVAPYPATLSFLTPAMDEERKIYPERVTSMQLIAAIAADIRSWLPDHIGRYSDEYNPNCTGDKFQSLSKPTILFEAGHFKGDYQREITRKYMTAALFSALGNIASGKWKTHEHKKYLEIPENQKLFYDIILRQALVNGEIKDVAIQFKEKLDKDDIIFVPHIDKIAASLSYFGHKEINCKNYPLTLANEETLRENVIVNNMYINNEVLAINYQNI